MRKNGKLPGGLISEEINAHSQKWFVVSTAPEIDQAYWSTVVFPAEERAIFFGLFRRRVPNLHKKIFSIIRNSGEEAHEAHEAVEELIRDIEETRWRDLMPNPLPPDGVKFRSKK